MAQRFLRFGILGRHCHHWHNSGHFSLGSMDQKKKRSLPIETDRQC